MYVFANDKQPEEKEILDDCVYIFIKKWEEVTEW